MAATLWTTLPPLNASGEFSDIQVAVIAISVVVGVLLIVVIILSYIYHAMVESMYTVNNDMRRIDQERAVVGKRHIAHGSTGSNSCDTKVGESHADGDAKSQTQDIDGGSSVVSFVDHADEGEVQADVDSADGGGTTQGRKRATTGEPLYKGRRITGPGKEDPANTEGAPVENITRSVNTESCEVVGATSQTFENPVFTDSD